METTRVTTQGNAPIHEVPRSPDCENSTLSMLARLCLDLLFTA